MELEPIYFDRNVLITNQIATIFGVSYPVRAISSIRIHRRENASGCMRFVWIIIGGMILAAFGSLSLGGLADKTATRGELLTAGVMASAGVLLIISAVRLKGPPPVFDLILVTNAGEGVVMKSKDPDYVQHVRAAVEQAIIGAGQPALGRE